MREARALSGMKAAVYPGVERGTTDLKATGRPNEPDIETPVRDVRTAGLGAPGGGQGWAGQTEKLSGGAGYP